MPHLTATGTAVNLVELRIVHCQPSEYSEFLHEPDWQIKWIYNEDLWTQIRDIVQEAVIKTIPKKKKYKKTKWLSEEALQIAEQRR